MKEGITNVVDRVEDMYILNGKLYSLTTLIHSITYTHSLYSYLISDISGITEDKFITKLFGNFDGQTDVAITEVVSYNMDIYSDKYYERQKKILSYTYNDGIIFINPNLGELRILYIKSGDFLTEDDLKTWKNVDSSIALCYPNFGNNIYYKDITLQYDNKEFLVNSNEEIQRIETPTIDTENNSILFKLVGERTQTGWDEYYFSLDLEGNLPNIIQCYNNKDDATIKRPPKKDTSYIISIAPIN